MAQSSSRQTFLMTSESVGEGHPDKLCDQVSDAVLDACLEEDKTSKVACECATKTGMLILFGEISTNARINYQEVVRNMVKQIGYDDSSKGFDYKTCNVMVVIHEQTPDIAQGVHLGKKDEEIGAGDQGMMFGYATDETEELMPLSIVLAHKLNKRLAECRRNNILDWINPDSKTQVTIEYKLDNGACVPVRVHTIVISVHHKEETDLQHMRDELMEKVIQPVVDAKYLDENTKYYLQPSGKYVIGGPMSDAGCTGRKIIVDTYGGWGSHGGGAFSGKDPSKVDRSACYAARWIAKSLVASGLARRALIQLSYAIGVPEPLSLYIDTYGTGKKSNEELLDIIKHNFDLRPGCIIRDLDLKQPIYRNTACYGHFGRSEFTWEKPKDLQ